MQVNKTAKEQTKILVKEKKPDVNTPMASHQLTDLHFCLNKKLSLTAQWGGYVKKKSVTADVELGVGFYLKSSIGVKFEWGWQIDYKGLLGCVAKASRWGGWGFVVGALYCTYSHSEVRIYLKVRYFVNMSQWRFCHLLSR